MTLRASSRFVAHEYRIPFTGPLICRVSSTPSTVVLFPREHSFSNEEALNRHHRLLLFPQVWTARDGVDVASFRLYSSQGRRADRILKSAYAKSRADLSASGPFASGGDKRWVKRGAESTKETSGHDLLQDVALGVSSAHGVATSKLQYSYVHSEELEALVQEGLPPKDVRELLQADVLETDPSHLLPPKEVDTIHRMLDVFLRGFAVLAAELSANAADPPATLAKIWVTFCRGAETHFTTKYESEMSHFLQRDRISLAQKMVEARTLAHKLQKHQQEKAVVDQRLARVLADQRRVMDDVTSYEGEVEKWRIRAEEAARERDELEPELLKARARVESLEEALQGLSKLAAVADDTDDVRAELEAEYGAELQRLQALISAAQQEAMNAMAREREVLMAEEQTRREKRRAQAEASELRDDLNRLQQEFNALQVSTAEARVRAESSLLTATRELSVERVSRETAQREVAKAQVEIAQERQHTKAALQAEADQAARTRDAALKLSERDGDLANERGRVRLAEAGRQAAEEASAALRKQLEGAKRSLMLYRAASGEAAAKDDRSSTQLANLQQELSEANALIETLSAEKENAKKEVAEMRTRLASSQEGDVEHARALAVMTSEMEVMHGKTRDAQRAAIAAAAELESTKKKLAECLVSTQEAKEKAADAEASLEAETKTRVRVEDDLGAANAQVAETMRMVRELRAASKEAGGLNDDLIEARVALAAAREEVDTLRLKLSGFEQEARAGGTLKSQKETAKHLEAARDELLSIFKLGRKSADGVEPKVEEHVKDGVALEALEDAFSDLNSRNNQWRDQVKALDEEIVKKDEQARQAIAIVTAEKEQADARATEAELNAIREIDIMREQVEQCEARINRLRVEMFGNMTAIQSTLDEVGCSQASLATPDDASANDQDLCSGAKDHIKMVRESMFAIVKEREMYAEQCTELSATSAEATEKIANLEVELRMIGEASEMQLRSREAAEAEMKTAKTALSEMEVRLTTALERAQRSESLLNKSSKTMGTQAGPGLAEPKPKKEEAQPKEAIKPTTMDDGNVPEHEDKIIPREPPPPPRVYKPPIGWGSTWATAPRTRPDLLPQSTVIREVTFGLPGGKTTARRRINASPTLEYEVASERLGLRQYFDMMASRADGRSELGIRRPETADYAHPHLARAHVVSETNPKPLVKEEEHVVGSVTPATRPQTSPALVEGALGPDQAAHRRLRPSPRTSMHPPVERQEIALGKLKYSGDTLTDASGKKHHQTMVPARLGTLIKSNGLKGTLESSLVDQ